MYLFDYTMIIIGMAMSCGIISDITCMFYFLCKITVIIKINKFIYFSYIVSIISVNGTMLINNNIICTVVICTFLYCVVFAL